jgi:RNA polymerase sigma factor for flagellar operon FliA
VSGSVRCTTPPTREPEHPMTATAPSSDLDRLWTEYQDGHPKAVRDRLIVHYAPLVKFVAGRVGSGLPHHVEQADLASYGIIGLIGAIDRFDPARGFKFETYAIARIKGAILDELRAIDWVPRTVRSKGRALEQAFASLEAKLHRAPTDAELAEHLEWSDDELQTTMQQLSFTGLVALDQLLGGERESPTTLGDTIPDDDPGPLAAYEVTELRARLADAVRGLPEREKIVVGLYYYEGLTLAEIGSVLGVTESRVCQIHTRSVLHLRARLARTQGEPV